MQKKNNYKKTLAAAMSYSLIASNVMPAFATNQVITENNNAKTEVTYNKASSFSVTIPKNITLGNDKQSNYSVKVEGDISSDQEVSVVPVDSSDTDGLNFYMKDQNTNNPKPDVLANITHAKTNWNFQDVANAYTETNNSVSAPNLTSGEWKGTFNFEINTHTLEPEMPSINGFIDGGTYDTGTSITIKDNETLKINDEIVDTTDNKYTFNEEGNFKVSVSDDSGNEVSVNITIKHTHTYVDGVCTGCGDTKSATPKATIDNLIDGGTYPTETAVSVPKNAILKVNNDNVSLSNNKYTFDEEGTYDVVLSDEETETSLQINISDTKGTSIDDLVNNGTYSEKTSINVTDDETLSINGKEIELTDGKYTFDGEGSYEVTTTDKDGNKVIVVVVIQHSCYYSEKITKEATYTEDGEKTYTCIKCKDTVTEVIPKLVDTTAPSGSITVANNVWRSLLNTITFNTFFRDTQDIVISAEDNESGVKEIAYYLSDEQIEEAELSTLSWSEYTDKVAIFPNNNYVIYARIKDNQNNVTYISSDGIVLDNVAPNINGLADGETYPTGTTVTIQDGETLKINGETVAITDNTHTFEEAGKFTITVSDQDGNEASVTITIECEHDFVNRICTKCGAEVAPSSKYRNWNYTLNDEDNTITLNYYTGSETNITVYGYYEVNKKIYQTKIASNDTNAGSNYMFAGNSTVESITFNKGIDTNNTDSMYCMFFKCTKLKSIDIVNLDTSNTINMCNMFNCCYQLADIDLSNFNTSAATNMARMFYYCISLTNLDVSSFDTSNVTNMASMFNLCTALTSLDLSNFDTGNVTDMNNMFERCNSLTDLDVSNFNTSNVTDMNKMFCNCSSLINLDLSSFDTNNVTDMSKMFYYCIALTGLDISSFDNCNVTNMSQMFYDCKSLTRLNLDWFGTPNVTNMGEMFRGCSSLTSLNVSNFDTSNVTNMSAMFASSINSDDMKLREIIGLNNFDTSNVLQTNHMFYCCSALENLDLCNWDTSKITAMNHMFYSCKKLRKIYATEGMWTTSQANTTSMFEGCWSSSITYK